MRTRWFTRHGGNASLFYVDWRPLYVRNSTVVLSVTTSALVGEKADTGTVGTVPHHVGLNVRLNERLER